MASNLGKQETNDDNRQQDLTTNHTAQELQRRRRRRRWGDATTNTADGTATTTTTATTTAAVTTATTTGSDRAPIPSSSSAIATTNHVQDAKTKALALQESIRARLAALKAKTASTNLLPPPPPPPPSQATIPPPPQPFTTTGGTKSTIPSTNTATTTTMMESITTTKKRAANNMESSSTTTTDPSGSKVKRARHFELDLTVTAPTFATTTEALLKSQPKINPYLAHHTISSSSAPQTVKPKHQSISTTISTSTTTTQRTQASSLPNNQDEEEILDPRLVRASKPRSRHKPITFVEPGTFVEIAERKRNRAANAEQSGFLSGRKQGQYVSATNMVPSNQVYYGRTSDDFGDDQHDDDDDHDNHNKTMGHILLPPRPEVQDKTITPTVMEWWDLMELVPSKWKKQVVAYEGKLWNQSQVQSNWLTSSDKKQQQQQDVTTNTTTTTTTTTGIIQYLIPKVTHSLSM